jgi:DNA modification methylase
MNYDDFITSKSFQVWRRYANPVWMDIRQSNTLNKRVARSEKDERHICPLQLDVIARGIELWTNENDIVLDPFMGIGSTQYVALGLNRRTIEIELKESYFVQAILNVDGIESKKTVEEKEKIIIEQIPLF